MKMMIILIGLMTAFSFQAQASTKAEVTDLVPVDNMYAVFEIKTPKFEKVILDCQSFINGVSFYNDEKLVHEIRMVDYGNCDAVYDFISQSKIDSKPVCMEILEEGNELSLSNDGPADCQ